MYCKRNYFLLTLLFLVSIGVFLYIFFDAFYQKAEFTPKKSIAEKKETLSLVFVGDLMLDRNVRLLGQKYGYESLFLNIKDFLSEYDFAVANLEGVFTRNESESIKNNKVLRFTFDPVGVLALKESGIDIVSQANNHTSDFGREGALYSREVIKDAELLSFGDFWNESEPIFLNSKSYKVALIAVNEFVYNNFDKILSEISNAKEQGYFVIVFPHWGTEYQKTPNSFQETKAREWINNGADVIIGSHPHVIQTIEEYNGKLIFYSLGNFIFDQYFSKDVKEGIAVSLILDEENVYFQITPLQIDISEPIVASPEKASEILNFIATNSVISSTTKSAILNGKSIVIRR